MESNELNLIQLAQYFSNEDAARVSIEKLRRSRAFLRPFKEVIERAQGTMENLNRLLAKRPTVVPSASISNNHRHT
jgi:hypothetical protein